MDGKSITVCGERERDTNPAGKLKETQQSFSGFDTRNRSRDDILKERL